MPSLTDIEKFQNAYESTKSHIEKNILNRENTAIGIIIDYPKLYYNAIIKIQHCIGVKYTYKQGKIVA